ncbi:hypothetical protein CEXT_270001 [Caerostris extrusa]|uniref:Uncharacterized protein n=1 Tax=Caerostris extrusa TaxID=172846 RepID=A0AAV4PE96_CAEEX|nr:hypothetical protein CEXT_270001 [Caerostris extrusa]
MGHRWGAKLGGDHIAPYQEIHFVLSSSITSRRSDSSRLITAEEIDPKQISPNSYSGGDNAPSLGGQIGGTAKGMGTGISG